MPPNWMSMFEDDMQSGSSIQDFYIPEQVDQLDVNLSDFSMEQTLPSAEELVMEPEFTSMNKPQLNTTIEPIGTGNKTIMMLNQYKQYCHPDYVNPHTAVLRKPPSRRKVKFSSSVEERLSQTVHQCINHLSTHLATKTKLDELTIVNQQISEIIQVCNTC